MFKPSQIFFIGLTFAFIYCGAIQAQNDEYFFYHLTTQQGLSGNEVYAILEDSKGMIWIGTQNGLNSYNGYELKKYDRTNDPPVISEGKITCLFEDKTGIIWIGTFDKGLYTYDPVTDHFNICYYISENSTENPSIKIKTIFQDDNDIIWIGTGGGGLVRLDKGSGEYQSYLISANNQESKSNIVSAITAIDKDKLLIGTYKGLFLFDQINANFISYDIIPNISEIYQQIFNFHRDPDSNIWFGTLKGLFKYNPTKKSCVQIISRSKSDKDNLKDDAISFIQASFAQGQDVLWLATKNGLVRYDVHTDYFRRILIDPQKNYSLSNDFINTLYLNDNGILWIGTAWSGIDRMDTEGSPFKQVQIQPDNEELFYTACGFCVDHKGYLWVSACKEGLFKFDHELNNIAQYSFEKGFTIDANSPITNHIDYIYEDNNSVLWLGLCGWGPVIFNRRNGAVHYLNSNLNNNEKYKQERINSIIEDDDGNYWIGADGGIFFKENGSSINDSIRFLGEDVVDQTLIFDVFESSNGNVYFGTLDKGVYSIRKEDRESLSFHYYGKDETEPGLFNSTVFDLYEDVNHNLWAATSKGLNKYNPDNGKFELIYDSTGILELGVSQVLGDKYGNLWLSLQNGGLVKYQPITKRIKVYDINDGLPFDNLVTRYWYQSEDGRIFIPGYLGDGSGFLFFHPDSIFDNTNIPNIAITDFRVGNNQIPLDTNISAIDHIKLKHNQNFFSFQFAALDYTNPEKNQYAYYLEGLDDDWIYSGNRRYANYTSVPPGKYVFHVKGSNNDGYWNETGSDLCITVLPPPWRTTLAYIIYGFVILGLVFLWRRYDLKRQQLKQNLEIEKVEADKLKELDSMKSRFFANISHEFRTPLTLILGPIEKIKTMVSREATRDIEMMQRNAKRLQQLINQILSLSKIESGYMKLQASELNIISLVNNYVQSFESLAKQKQISFDFYYDKSEILVYADQEKFETILYNLFSNAFKFTPEEGKIVVEIETRKQNLVISLFNSGSSIPADKLPHIFDRFYQADDSYSRDYEGTGIGLALTKDLIELHHGEITVESESAKGTTFTVKLLLGKNHLSQEDIVEKKKPVIITPSLHDLDIQEDIIKGPSSETGTSFKPLLLIVEDNADLRAYIRSYLDENYSIIEAHNGEEGLVKAIEMIPDIVISDVMMPKMDGFEMCEGLKTDERTSHIPIVLLTARASEESKIQGLETGADDYLYKPFNHHELLVRVSNLIEQRKKIREYFIREMGLDSKVDMQPEDIRISSMDEKFLARTQKIVNEHMSDPDFSIEEFGKLVGMSRSQLHRKLTALVNLSPTAFVRSIRLNKAASLILHKSGTISEIAFEVGFNNLSYFAKSFREVFGVLPSEYSDTQNEG